MAPVPTPPPFLRAIALYLQEQEASLWEWFASTQKRNEQADAVRLDLLKSTYRIELQAQPGLYDLAHSVRDSLQLRCGVTLYQAQRDGSANAGLAYVPGEAHIIFAGALASVLSTTEMRAVLGHELAHFALYEEQPGDYLVAADLLRALATDPVAGAVASESARLFSLWSEIHADRWALHVSDDISAAISALVKVNTGATEVSAESYLRQADEIFNKTTVQADQETHPEPFIRARALKLWAERGEAAQAEIKRMIEGNMNLQRLDLIAQKHAATLTRQFLQRFLTPMWFRTEAVLGHAKRFFADFGAAGETPAQPETPDGLEHADASLRDYFCYLMLDFITADRDLDDVALAQAIVEARRLGLNERFAELAQKELGLGKRAYGKIDKDAEAILARTEETQLT